MRGNRPRSSDCPPLSPNHHLEAHEPTPSGQCVMTSYRSMENPQTFYPDFYMQPTEEVRKEKNRKRYIGVDLHSNSFTACILLEGAEPETLQLQGGGLEQFIRILQPNDELAVEATGNSR